MSSIGDGRLRLSAHPGGVESGDLNVMLGPDERQYLANRGPERAQLDRDIDRLSAASRRHGAGADHEGQLPQPTCAYNRAVRCRGISSLVSSVKSSRISLGSNFLLRTAPALAAISVRLWRRGRQRMATR